MRRTARLVVLGVALAASAASCRGNSNTAPSPVLATDTFTGTIAPLGSSSHPFTVTYASGYTDASITVTSLVSVATGTPQSITIGVGFGVISVGVCTRVTGYSNSAATLNAELPTTGGTFGPGQFCVQIFDNPDSPTVTEPLTYTMIVKHY